MLEVLAMTYSVDANNDTPDPFTLTDVNVWELQEKWLLDLMEEYDMTRGSGIDVRIYRLLEDIKMLLESGEVWFVRLRDDEVQGSDS